MRILEEFWYGNIEPMEYGPFSNEEYKELLRLITKNEEKLQATFSNEQKELFSKYTDCIQEFQTISERLLLQNSFRLGARMILEIMEERLQ